jgi:transposase InsO family protein
VAGFQTSISGRFWVSTEVASHELNGPRRLEESTRHQGAAVAPDLGRWRSLGRQASGVALGALLRAHDLLGHAAGRHLREARAQEDPLLQLQARLDEAELKARLAWEIVDILRARLGKIPEGRRPYYTPAHRFRILEFKRLLGWTRAETAATFLVCPNTIGNWEGQVRPGATTVGSTVRPTPPVVRFADAVRSFVQAMKRFGFGSDDLLALTLVRAGWKISARSVGRIVREKLLPEPAPAEPTRPRRPVKASFVGHVWMADTSEVRAFLGGTFHMAALFDAFSRVPLLLGTYDHRPTSRELAELLNLAGERFGRPRYVITDLGAEFKGAFRQRLRELGVVQRYRRKDYIAGTARLESFWRTLKNMAALRLPTFLTLADLERRLAPALVHYTSFRPHRGLRGATPAEAFLGLEPAIERARRAPRGRPGEGGTSSPWDVVFLDDHEKRFPVLVPAAA